ncbi:MAG: hypothetical protein FD163_2535 [Hyphomonadaceae bacterium]|nr:MAG: hypothetical protein FD128_2635 [Hyphomonadaceae bacterium]KAF0182670.1 MAG: hypothetical protein FD163_2535 [Hyphomonadaceae bacterium]
MAGNFRNYGIASVCHDRLHQCDLLGAALDRRLSAFFGDGRAWLWIFTRWFDLVCQKAIGDAEMTFMEIVGLLSGGLAAAALLNAMRHAAHEWKREK